MKALTLLENGKIIIPDEHQTDPLHIKTPWSVEYIRGRNVQVWYRHKELGDKPYIPEGYVEINKERFKVKASD